MASSALQVKVPTTKVISALTKKLEQIKKNKAAEATLEAKFQKAYAAWNKQLQAYATKNISKATNLRVNYQEWKGTMNIDYDVPVSPTEIDSAPVRDFDRLSDHEYEQTVEQITNALNILHMTEEEYVNASTMKHISKYL